MWCGENTVALQGISTEPACILLSDAKHFIATSESCYASIEHGKHISEGSADVLGHHGTAVCAL